LNKWVFGLISVLILAVIPGLSRAEAQPCRTVTVVAGTSSGDRAVAISGVIETLRAAGFQVTTPEAQRSIAQLQGRGNRVPLYTTCRYLFVKVVNIREERGTALDLAIPIRVSRSTRIGMRFWANSIAEQLEKRVALRRVMKGSLDQIMEAGALGAKIVVAGRIGEGSAISLFLFPALLVVIILLLRYLRRE